jgi:hypothetical protein
MKRPCESTDDYDAFTGWRRVHFWQRGELRKIKRRASKRDRRRVRTEIRSGAHD